MSSLNQIELEVAHRAGVVVRVEHALPKCRFSPPCSNGANHALSVRGDVRKRRVRRLLSLTGLNEKIEVRLIACKRMKRDLVFNVRDQELGPKGERDFLVPTPLNCQAPLCSFLEGRQRNLNRWRRRTWVSMKHGIERGHHGERFVPTE